MAEIFRSCGLALSAAQLAQFWDYHSLLRERNPALNLTRVRNFRNMVLKLYVDSLLQAEMVELPSPLLDLGTGPGMPGIPLKIYRPQLEILLAESRGKRVEFLQAALARLDLPGLRLAAGRVTARTEEPVAGVITRAVEPIETTLERVQGCLAQDGRVVFMKGPHCAAEIESACRRFARQYDLVLDRAYTIPGTRHERRLLVYRRLDAPAHHLRSQARARHGAQPVTSRQNPFFRDMKKLLTGRGIRKAGRAIVAGAKPIAEILARHPHRAEAWLSCGEEAPPPPQSPSDLRWVELAPELFAELDVFGTHAPLLVISLPPIAPWDPAEGFADGCSLLLPFQDPENVGAAIRSAAAFGATQVILLAESAHPFHPKALRAAGGNVLDLRLRQGPALDDLPADLPVLALSAEGQDIHRAAFPAAFGLLPGLEGRGLPPRWRRKALRIAIRSEVESLNAAAAVSIALYEWRRRIAGEAAQAPGPDEEPK
jgi:16S rRNA (guanine(527)-N(7))-methyltransferase RsmG